MLREPVHNSRYRDQHPASTWSWSLPSRGSLLSGSGAAIARSAAPTGPRHQWDPQQLLCTRRRTGSLAALTALRWGFRRAPPTRTGIVKAGSGPSGPGLWAAPTWRELQLSCTRRSHRPRREGRARPMALGRAVFEHTHESNVASLKPQVTNGPHGVARRPHVGLIPTRRTDAAARW